MSAPVSFTLAMSEEEFTEKYIKPWAVQQAESMALTEDELIDVLAEHLGEELSKMVDSLIESGEIKHQTVFFELPNSDHPLSVDLWHNKYGR